MPIVTLLTARSLHHGGIKFVKGRGKKVTDKVAAELENDLPEGTFDINYDENAEETPEPVAAKPKAKANKSKITFNKRVSPGKAAALARVNKTSDDEVPGDELEEGEPGRVVTV